MKLECMINNGCNLQGIDWEDIKFSWYPEEAGKCKVQRSCRILVAEHYETLLHNQSDYYDSGWLMSSRSIEVSFPGLHLKPASVYYIRIMAIYEEENAEYSSDIVKCITGIAPDDWKASWIGGSRMPGRNEFTYFHRSYQVEKQVRNAIIYISAHNHFKLWLNGSRLNGEVAPAPSHIYRSKYYLTYDISDRLRQGKNDLNCILYYQNCHGQNYMNGLPGIILQEYIYYEDGSYELWNSDESWDILEDTPYQTGMPCQQNRSISSVISYDFNHEAANWLQDGYS